MHRQVTAHPAPTAHWALSSPLHHSCAREFRTRNLTCNCRYSCPTASGQAAARPPWALRLRLCDTRPGVVDPATGHCARVNAAQPEQPPDARRGQSTRSPLLPVFHAPKSKQDNPSTNTLQVSALLANARRVGKGTRWMVRATSRWEYTSLSAPLWHARDRRLFDSTCCLNGRVVVQEAHELTVHPTP